MVMIPLELVLLLEQLTVVSVVLLGKLNNNIKRERITGFVTILNGWKKRIYIMSCIGNIQYETIYNLSFYLHTSTRRKSKDVKPAAIKNINFKSFPTNSKSS